MYFLPPLSHPPANLDSTMDIDQLEDPDAFFDAYEKIESNLFVFYLISFFIACAICCYVFLLL